MLALLEEKEQVSLHLGSKVMSSEKSGKRVSELTEDMSKSFSEGAAAGRPKTTRPC